MLRGLNTPHPQSHLFQVEDYNILDGIEYRQQGAEKNPRPAQGLPIYQVQDIGRHHKLLLPPEFQQGAGREGSHQ